MASPALWLLGDQLGPHFHDAGEHADRDIVLIESTRALGRRRYHRQKLHLVLTAMRALAEQLGDRVTLIRADTYREGLRRYGRPVVVHEPHSHAADRLARALRDEGTVTDIVPTAGFALPRPEFAAWARDRRRFLLEDFYRSQRERFGVLLDGERDPVGGRWNFDRENRAAPPHSPTLGVPGPWQPVENDLDDAVRADLDRAREEGRIDPVGADGPRRFAVTRTEALHALRTFVADRLPTFGRYQDAMLADDWAMSHALLSVPLNLGLLDPLEVVAEAERAYHDSGAPLAAVEGFVRQVLGWREWIWHLYWHPGPRYLRHNRLAARRRLPRWWRELDADAVEAHCLRTALRGVHDRGYAHHIQRLMVLGNHALQRGYHPGELTDWFATAFVDGFPWVMPPNVIGMSQYADGGVVATKPYAAGGAYIDRMSDHCSSCAFDPKARVGERACPFTAGYWAFLHRNAERLRGNHRMRRPLAGLNRLRDLDQLLDQERGRRRF
ncbi:cryptochrome/photolyase family protein [Saccharomonospora piscinae]|uniref:cryptochrome/photolyase family protein n=1 Tax=Saccharomonospora piscinae TaxID=687388 RepID=UPI001106F2C7|nr:cryptochrome/photolyase family protein [Saccharomonospora piscinae]TLW90472.1 cryptochrome/photolyase family protein [Saccharomonospora piscinae]